MSRTRVRNQRRPTSGVTGFCALPTSTPQQPWSPAWRVPSAGPLRSKVVCRQTDSNRLSGYRRPCHRTVWRIRHRPRSSAPGRQDAAPRVVSELYQATTLEFDVRSPCARHPCRGARTSPRPCLAAALRHRDTTGDGGRPAPVVRDGQGDGVGAGRGVDVRRRRGAGAERRAVTPVPRVAADAVRDRWSRCCSPSTTVPVQTGCGNVTVGPVVAGWLRRRGHRRG